VGDHREGRRPASRSRIDLAFGGRRVQQSLLQKGPNDQGIGWNVLTSLGRVGIGFGMAALVGIPLGFMLGRFRFSPIWRLRSSAS